MNSDDDYTRPIKLVRDTAQMHLVMATLLVTVTFAAGFTLPGGFESDKDSHDKGMAILTKKSAFCAFVVTDAIAFVCSAGAVFSYFFMAMIHRPTIQGPSDIDLTQKELRTLLKTYRLATILLFLSMSAVVIAFVTGLYATLANSVGLAATVCVIDSNDTRIIKMVRDVAQIHLVVATLLVTVTFAAGFTLPGGFESDKDSSDKGMAILTKKSAFCAFVVTDAIAFVCSAGAVFSYFVMAMTDRPKMEGQADIVSTQEELRILIKIARLATILLFLSMSAVVIAFVTGLYATLANSVGLAASVCVIGCLAFLIYVLVFYVLCAEVNK
ncbi:hypothetical protein KY289_024923 [Solanum tuberosum]|nr:hypothetical protein KY289_024923 [Solanum tuberosum]